MISEQELREQICQVGREMYDRKYIIGMDGNISVQLPNRAILCTPSGKCKGKLKPEEIMKVTSEGKKAFGLGKVSSEIQVHLAAYQERDDIRAVIHAHPQHIVTISLIDPTLLEQVLLPETAYYLKNISLAPFHLPGTQDLADSIRRPIQNSDSIAMQRHGSLTVGTNLEEAYYKLEYMEHAASVAFQLLTVQRQVDPLSSFDVERLRKSYKGTTSE